MKEHGIKPKKTGFLLLAAAMLALTVIAAAKPVDAFRLGNYDVGLNGISKAEKINDGQAARFHDQTQIMGKVTNTEIVEGIREVNRNRYSRSFMKSAFADQRFCVVTEDRVAYLDVDSSGELSLMGSVPQDCYVVTTTEAALSRSWFEYENGLPMSYSDVKERFDIPFRVKARIALARTFG